MKAIKLALISFALTVTAAACGKNAAVADMEGLAEKVCACKDAECAAKESEKMSELMQKHASATGSESDAKAIQAAATKMMDCVKNLSK